MVISSGGPIRNPLIVGFGAFPDGRHDDEQRRCKSGARLPPGARSASSSALSGRFQAASADAAEVSDQEPYDRWQRFRD
jgi:hypothetical protein